MEEKRIFDLVLVKFGLFLVNCGDILVKSGRFLVFFGIDVIRLIEKDASAQNINLHVICLFDRGPTSVRTGR